MLVRASHVGSHGDASWRVAALATARGGTATAGRRLAVTPLAAGPESLDWENDDFVPAGKAKKNKKKPNNRQAPPPPSREVGAEEVQATTPV